MSLPGSAPGAVMARSHSHRAASLLQHRTGEVLVPIVWGRMVVAVRVVRRIVARSRLPQRLTAQRTSARIGPAGGPVHCGQSHAPRGPAAPHVRVSGHFMTCHSRTLKKSSNDLHSLASTLYTGLPSLINERV